MESRLAAPSLATPTAARPPDSDPLDSPLRLKRQKVTVACDQCRIRKIKCDGVQPVCSRCLKRRDSGVHCSWLHHRASRSESHLLRGRILGLQKRIKELEEKDDVNSDASLPARNAKPLEQHDENYLGATSGRETFPASSYRTILPEIHAGRVSSDPGDTMPHSYPESQPLQPSMETISPINAMIGSIDGDGDRLGIFGSSSAGSFVSQIRRAVDRRIGPLGSKTPHADVNSLVLLGIESKNGERGQDTSDYELPSRKKADMFMSIYWHTGWPIYPFTDKIELVSYYESLWTGQGLPDDETEFLSMINTIFAMGCRASVNSSQRDRRISAEIFFQRAKGFLSFWKPGSLRTVQCFLLFAQYLQSTNEPHQCWMCVGHAVRTALSIGLHLPETSAQIPSLRMRELVRRVWHGCVLMDRALAMTYGRPTMIERSIAVAVPLPMAIDTESPEPTAAVEHACSPSLIDFFIQIIKLYSITYEILFEFYTPQPKYGNPSADKHDTYFSLHASSERSLSILDIDRNLMIWESKVPTYLKNFHDQLQEAKCGKCSDTRCTFLRQAVVLRQRFLHMKLLSLRPILTAFVASEMDYSDNNTSFGTDLSTRVSHQCSIVCIKIAQEAINLVYSNRSPDWEAIGFVAVWWYNVLFVYSAATVLIAARLKASILSEIGEKSILESWGMAMNILEGYISFSDSIARLVTALHVLFDEVPAIYSQRMQQQQGAPLTLNQDSNTDSVAPHIEDSEYSGAGREGHGEPGAQPASDLPYNLTIFTGDPRLQMPHFQHRVVPELISEEYSTAFDLSLDPRDFSWLSTNPFDF